MPTRILIAYDGSGTAGTAVRVAGALFPGARAIIATVAPDVAMRTETVSLAVPTMSPELVQRTIDELLAEARGEAESIAREGAERADAHGLDAEPTATDGGAPTWSAVLELAHDRGVDAIVCGTRGRAAIARAVLGSTSTSLLHHADLPLLIVPNETGEPDGPVLLAYDGSEPAVRAIELSGRLLAGRRAVIVHVWESQYRHGLTAKALRRGPVDDVREIVKQLDQSLAEAATARTQEGVELARAAGLVATGEALESDASVWQTVVSAAREHDAAVIVSGARGLGGARSALLGSVSSGLVHNADLPVLVVPASIAA